MLSAARKLWNRGRDLLPIAGFHFDRPLVIFQSDDWGRVGLRDQEGLDALRLSGLALGERSYDLYTLETADDLDALIALLNRHRDSTGRAACIVMNFILANLDFGEMEANGFERVSLLPLADGLPTGWERPGLLDSYREGIRNGVFHPALHGITHFCRLAVERALATNGDRATLLRTLWRAGTPYIYWRLPWIGYEYWDPEGKPDERFLAHSVQCDLIGQAVGAFTKLFSTLPHSACAPGYRANDDTHTAWAQYGIAVTQNGPGTSTPPHFDQHGLLHLYRTIEFEPATDQAFSVDECVARAEADFSKGLPAIVSIHSINFQSSVSGFRDRTLNRLDQFLSALEARHPNLLYLHDRDLHELVEKGFYETQQGKASVQVTRKKFTKHELRREQIPG